MPLATNNFSLIGHALIRAASEHAWGQGDAFGDRYTESPRVGIGLDGDRFSKLTRLEGASEVCLPLRRGRAGWAQGRRARAGMAATLLPSFGQIDNCLIADRELVAKGTACWPNRPDTLAL